MAKRIGDSKNGDAKNAESMAVSRRSSNDGSLLTHENTTN
jgi:hypothetical protein